MESPFWKPQREYIYVWICCREKITWFNQQEQGYHQAAEMDRSMKIQSSRHHFFWDAQVFVLF